ncbi:MAG: hypothetical protein KJ720_13545 [Proteobacteria bacterium]|nr:hypothetical protein [Pseudomonadota bacterium]MBU1449829.1 hypothetical protein [Pseudomonadota bacterium]MBU2467971.1 hypothetical protein [Pseudomonadota bacterium]MBU2516605.1 hypothetical protein [Pseudomonadota bacterium]
MFKKLFKRVEEAPAASGQGKQGKPRDIHPAVGRELVVTFKEDPDWVWKLKQVQQTNAQGEHIRDYRVYDPTMAAGRGVVVRDYHSLDEHPALILYHGWVNKKNNDAQVLTGSGEQLRAS